MSIGEDDKTPYCREGDYVKENLIQSQKEKLYSQIKKKTWMLLIYQVGVRRTFNTLGKFHRTSKSQGKSSEGPNKRVLVDKIR